MDPNASRSFFADVDGNAHVVPKTGPHQPVKSLAGAGANASDDLEEILDDEEQKTYLDKMFEEQANEKLKNLPKIKLPKSAFNVTLKDYQKSGIRWLTFMETNNHLPPYYKEVVRKATGHTAYQCTITNALQNTKPSPLRGGLLCDEMGLGSKFVFQLLESQCFTNRKTDVPLTETLQAIGLMITNPPKPDSKRNITLVVCPVNVQGNWVKQMEDHVRGSRFKVTIYAGPSRSKQLVQIFQNQFDVVIVSYQTLASDWKNHEKTKKAGMPQPTLFSFEYHRVILDEAHEIRNANTAISKAAMAVEATHALAMTGTPFLNSPSKCGRESTC